MEAVASRRRGDIDGLRAVAVLAVLGFHAFGLPGGFAGVDVFFVISGFLITRIIVGDLAAGKFSFAGFYARRLRRIVPALAIVLAACLAFGWIVLFPDEYASLGKHVAGGAGFVANGVLWDEVGYFDALAATKPLLHLWSLGIEEQFYLAWPLLLWLGWRLRQRPRAIAGVLLVLSLASYVVLGTFYAPWTRLWELLIGALLAQRTARSSPLACAIGLVAIATSFAIPMHGAWLLVPTCGTALAIAGETAWLAPLAYLGRISYPLYLWHWPILAFLRILDGEPPSLLQRGLAIAASLVLAAVTHRFVEVPVQRGPTRRLQVLALLGALVVSGSAGFWVYAHDGVPSRPAAQAAPKSTGVDYVTYEGCVEAHPYARFGSCYDSPRTHAETLVMLGDSHGDALAPALVRAPLAMDLRIVTHAGCMPFRGVEYVDASGGRPYRCRETFDPAIAEILADRRVTIVMLVARHAIRVELTGFHERELVGDIGHFELADGTRDPETVFRRGLADTVGVLQARGIRVVFVDQVPELGFDPHACVSRPLGMASRTLATCSVPRADVVARQARYRAIVDAVAPGVLRVDPLPLFCDAAQCTAVHDGVLLYHDDDHLNARGADVLVSEILDKLAAWR